MANKTYCLSEAIKIAAEHARGGGERSVEAVLENVYRKLLELQSELEK